MGTVALKHIVKYFGKSLVVNDIDEVIQDGEFVTLLGPSGCGKTTILRMVAGFEKPSSGEIWFDDQLVVGGKTFLPPEKRNIGMVFQSYAVWPHMTVSENTAYPLTIRKMPKEEIRQKVEKTLELMHLSQYKDRLPDQLSGGQQQRVALARALVGEPKLLLLDEPAAGMNPQETLELTQFIKEIRDKYDLTVFMIEHHMDLVMQISDRIYVLDFGKLIAEGTPAEIQNNQRVIDAYLGVDDNE